MALGANTEAIIRLAWCRRLGLADDALEIDDLGGGARVEVEQTRSSEGLGVVRLWDTTVLIGPAELIRAARALSADELLNPSRWAGLLSETGLATRWRGSERVSLSYADDYLPHDDRCNPDGARPLISEEPSSALELEARCPPDDRIGLGFAELPRRFVLLDESDQQRPVAGAGYTEAGALLARLTVLVAQTERRRRLGGTVGRIAVNDALDAGFVVEATAWDSNVGGQRLSESLAFSRVGCRIWCSSDTSSQHSREVP